MSQPYASYGSGPNSNDSPYGTHSGTGVSDFAQANPSYSSPLSQSAATQRSAFPEDGSQLGSSSVDENGLAGRDRSASTASTAVQAQAPSRSNTLKKKGSVRRTGSLRGNASKRSLAAGSVKGHSGAESEQEFNSAFFTPIPTQGTPTEVLANRFQAWRQLLKSLITYFREIQSSYDTRAKALHKVQNTVSNITHPSIFVSEHGLADATRILDDYHKRSIAEANKSRDIENDVIGALTGLRSDLGQKIKEIKSLSGDFKNNVEKEKEGTRREVDKLQEALQHADHEDGNATGKNDPFVVKLGVDRTIERQIDEENYLHRAYLNLESSGRELESIVVGEIQKAYNALAGILKREGDDAYHTVESLRTGPISMPKDAEWSNFVVNDPHFVDPDMPLRRIEDIEYPGKNHPAATEVRAGMLERKSKYLKSYTPGWYVLSPTHLHEFKSADKIYSQPPVMSLYLLDQKLGSKSEPGSSSHKFMLKGKQSGGMHKGHNWVFRAETHETMLAWYDDIHTLTESTGEQRNAFVRKHARSVSASDREGTVSSDGMEDDDDEADAVPYSADATSLVEQHPPQTRLQRPQPGGRFPSDLQVPRSAPMSPSDDSSEPDRDAIAAAGVISGSAVQDYQRGDEDPYRLDGVPSGSRATSSGYPQEPQQEHRREPQTYAPAHQRNVAYEPAQAQSSQPRQQPQSQPYQVPPQQTYASQQQQNVTRDPVQTQTYSLPVQQPPPVNQQQAPVNQGQMPSGQQQPQQQSFLGNEPADPSGSLARQKSAYGDWLAPAAAGVAGVGAGALGAEAYNKHEQRDDRTPQQTEQEPEVLPAKTYDPLNDSSRDEEEDAGVAGVGAGVLGAEAYNNREQRSAPAAQQTEQASYPTRSAYSYDPFSHPSEPADNATSFSLADALQTSQPNVGSTSVLSNSSAPASTTPAFGSVDRSVPSSSAPSAPSGTTLGGLEAKGAHETGRIFPLLRHDTDMSVSGLHVPGEFPKRPAP